MAKIPKPLKVLLTLLLIGGCLYFLGRGFYAHLDQIRAMTFTLRFDQLALGLVFTLLAYLSLTYAWVYGLKGISHHSLRFWDAIPVVNLPSLAKYIPGKMWSYLIQMVWLEKRGFPKSLVLFNNLLVVIVSTVASVVMGALFFFWSFEQYPWSWRGLILALVLVGDLIFVLSYRWCLRLATTVMNRVFKKNINLVDAPPRVLINLQLIFGVIYLFFGLGTLYTCRGFGLNLGHDFLTPLIGSMALADTIGFLALFAPGGIGVKESIFYVAIKHLIPENMALMIPIFSRLVAIIAEVILGLVAVGILHKAGVHIWKPKSPTT